MTIGLMGLAACIGWLTAAAAHWLDVHLDTVLDLGLGVAMTHSSATGRGPGWMHILGIAVMMASACGESEVERTVLDWWIAAALFVCGWIDWRQRILPNIVVLPLFLTGLLAGLLGCGLVDMRQVLLGAAVGLLIPLVVRLLGGSANEAMGSGDIKFVAAIGAWMGPVAVSAIFLLSAMTMLLVRAVATDEDRLPFGPALAAHAIGGLFLLAEMNARVQRGLF
jgi:prepilin signal peptidase PulO-like enzyme (type II secretory pathway)